MKKIFIILIGMIILSVPVLAETELEPLVIDKCEKQICPCIKIRKKMYAKRKKLYSRLQLTPSQRKLAYTIDDNYIVKLTKQKMIMMQTISPLNGEKIKNNPLKNTYKKAKKEYKKLLKNYDKEFKMILNKEQKNEYKILKKKYKQYQQKAY